MRILLVAYPFAAVNADPVGGSEQVVAQLDRALSAAGHTVTVIAREDSDVRGRLVGVPEHKGPIGARAIATVEAAMRAATAREAPEHEIVHMHGFDFGEHLPPPGPPVLATLHLPLDWYKWPHLNPTRPHTWLNPVSAAQVAAAPWATMPLLEPIANGIDLERFRPGRPRGYVLFLGRLCREKGLETAVRACRRTGDRLLIAGELFPYPAHRTWFERRIRPKLGPRARWLGPVTGAAKARLLAGAKAVMVPSEVPETGSLVTMEALASGAPVIGSDLGAIPTMVTPGVNGWLARPPNVRSFTQALARVGEIDRAAVRASAGALSVARTTAAYEALYRDLVARAAGGSVSERRAA